MTDQQNAGALSLVTLSGTLDVSDVLSVVTSRAELRLHQELEATKKRLQEAQDTVAKLTAEASKRYKDECRAAAEAVAAKLRPAVESCGGKLRVQDKDHWAIERRDRNDSGLLQQNVAVTGTKGSGGYECVFVATAEPSHVLVALEESIRAAQKDVDARQNEALRARKRLANVPLLERKARARLAEAKLSQTEDGREVLAALTSEFEADFLALPSN